MLAAFIAAAGIGEADESGEELVNEPVDADIVVEPPPVGACGVVGPEVPAAELAAPAGGRRRGRQLVELRLRKKAERATRCLETLTACVNPSLAKEVSRYFAIGKAGSLAPQARSSARLYSNQDQFVNVKVQRQAERHRNRAIISHLEQSVRRLPALLDDTELLVTTVVADDATIWTRLPSNDIDHQAQVRRSHHRAAVRRAAGKRVKRKIEKSSAAGRMVASPCLSLVQHLIRKSNVTPSGVSSSLTQIHAPMQVLPKANWKTIHTRKNRWSVWTGRACGAVFGGGVSDGPLHTKLNAAKVILMLPTNDAASVNTCIDAEEMKACESATNAAESRWRLHLGINCMGHQSCLTNKIACGICGDLDSTLVRAGHILEGARSFYKFYQAS